MQAREIRNEGLNRAFEITIPATEISDRVDRHLVKVGKTLRLPGFRPGKVPMPLLKDRYGKAVLSDVLQEAVNETVGSVMKDKGLRPALQPKVEVKDFDDGKDLVYTVAVEVLPEVKLAAFKDIALDRPVAKVTEEAVTDTLTRIAAQQRQSDPAPEGHKAAQGDVVVITFHGRTVADGKEHPGMHSHGFSLTLGSGQFIEGFEDQIVGHKAGDSFTVNVTFPEAYQVRDLAGQAAAFEVEIEEIRVPKDTPIDDALAKSMGLADLAALRKAVEDQMKAEYVRMSRLKVKRSLLDALDEAHVFDVPQGMIDIEFETISRQIELERKQTGAQDDLTDSDREELLGIAERRVRLGLVLAEIGRSNGIEVGDQELQRAVVQEARRYPGQERKVFDYYAKNRAALDSLRAPIFEDKVCDFVLELAKITDKDVSAEELAAEDDRPAPKPRQAKTGGGSKANPDSGKSEKAEKSAKSSKKKGDSDSEESVSKAKGAKAKKEK